AAAGSLSRTSPGKAEKKFVLRDSPAHIGVRKDDADLVAWLNVFIHYHQKPGGELYALAQKWLGESLAGLLPYYSAAPACAALAPLLALSTKPRNPPWRRSRTFEVSRFWTRAATRPWPLPSF